ncbi:hypothetical protein L6164_010444 [Bauhinia variegata]|uniref:Uncharacterized protein n=1 Tax=Bauhinia variegata TaxID=167791 RepID=A0ACB9PMC5_BAUVA|nr:hypothetical protein L6164_010444 [Bauhinia variegata]
MSHSSSNTTSPLDRVKRLDFEAALIALICSICFDTAGSGGTVALGNLTRLRRGFGKKSTCRPAFEGFTKPFVVEIIACPEQRISCDR